MNDLAQQIIGGLVRTGVAAFGAWAAAGGVVVTGTQLDQLTGSAMVLLAAGWSGIQKWMTNRNSRSIAVASAVASVKYGAPVTVTVTPPGEPNVATRISATEARAAPAVSIDVKPLSAPVEA